MFQTRTFDYQLVPLPAGANNDRDLLGEGPLWDPAGACLRWVDILGRSLNRWDLRSDTAERQSLPEQPGFVVNTTSKHLVLGTRSGLWSCLLPEAEPGPVRSRIWDGDYDQGTLRINDGKVDPAGRLWFGTIEDSETRPLAQLYRFGESVQVAMGNITTSNGLGWSPDSRRFYYTDSMARQIWSFDFDLDSGAISNRQVFAEDPSAYVPDGLAVDADGCVWAAKWDGAKVVRYRPDGSVDFQIEMPVRRPTSVAFIDSDLRTLAITSAQVAGVEEELAGRVFLIRTQQCGLAPTPLQVSASFFATNQ